MSDSSDAVWEDQGLFFTLIFNSGVVVGLGAVGYAIHRLPENARIMRMMRPGSRIATFFLPPNAAFEMAETEVMERVGVQPMFYVLMIKFLFYLFLGMCLTCVVVVSLCATDTYLNDFRAEEDPDRCRSQSLGDCDKLLKCAVLGFNESVFVGGTSSTNMSWAVVQRCEPKMRRGLFDLSVQNISPDSWRLYLFAVSVVLCCIPVGLVLRAVLRIVYNTVRSSFTRPVFRGIKYGGFSTVGARTVLISGLPSDAKILTAPELVLGYIAAEKDKKKEILDEKADEVDEEAQRVATDARRATMVAERQRAQKELEETREMTASMSLSRRQNRCALEEAGFTPDHSARHPSDPDGAAAAGAVEAPAEQDPSENSFRGVILPGTLEKEKKKDGSGGSRKNSSASVAAAGSGDGADDGASPQAGGAMDTSLDAMPAESHKTPTAAAAAAATGEKTKKRRSSKANGDEDDRDGEREPANLNGLSMAVRCQPLGAPADLDAASWELASRVLPQSVVIIRKAPDDLISLIEDEKDCLEKLADAIAAERAEEDPEKKPVKKRLIPQLWTEVEAVDYETKRLEEIRGKLEELLPERENQEMTGAVMFTFDRASSAYAFVRQYNAEFAVPTSEAFIAGSRDSVVWDNLAVNMPMANARFLVMVLVFIALVFFWGIPVGFLGSLENLGAIPGLGPAISSVLGVFPTTFVGTLGAYLPTIVITVFNILLPTMFRFFGRVGGVKNTDAELRTVLMMTAVFSIMSGIVMQAALQGGLTQALKLFTEPSVDAVVAFIIAIVSPSGGYWYSYLITAGCLGSMIRLLNIGPLIISHVIGRVAAGRQEEYDRLFEPRETDYAFESGRHVFFCAIGLLFHGTVAFLQPFAAVYAGIAYFVERSNIVDAGKTDDSTVLNYSYVLSYIHCVLTLHTVAAAGNVLVCSLKLSIGSPIIAAIGLACSIAMHVYARMYLADMIFTKPEIVASIERDTDNLGLPREQFEDVKPYIPDYATYKIDWDAERKIEAMDFENVDKTWPKPGAELCHDPPAQFLCFGEAAVKQQTIDSYSHRLALLEEENDRLRAFYTTAHRTANDRMMGGEGGAAAHSPVSADAIAVELVTKQKSDADEPNPTREPLGDASTGAS